MEPTGAVDDRGEHSGRRPWLGLAHSGRRPWLGLAAVGLALVGLLAFAFQVRAGWEPCDAGLGRRDTTGGMVIVWQQKSQLRATANALEWTVVFGPLGALLGIAAAIVYRRWWPLTALILVLLPVLLVAVQLLSGDQYNPWLWRYCGN